MPCLNERDPWVTPHTSSPAPPLPKRNTSPHYHSNTASPQLPVSGSSNVIQLLSETGSSTNDSLYESLKEEDEEEREDGYSIIPERDPPLPKDTIDDGSVQLVSVKGSANNTGPSGCGSVTGMTPLHHAAANSDVKLLQDLLSAMPIIQDPVERVLGTKRLRTREGVDIKDGEGRTALLHAVHSNSLRCVRVLVEQGASINMESGGEECLVYPSMWTPFSLLRPNIANYLGPCLLIQLLRCKV